MNQRTQGEQVFTALLTVKGSNEDNPKAWYSTPNYRKEQRIMSKYRIDNDTFSDGENTFSERNVCRHCMEECEANNLPFEFADVRYSFGIYAGRYCADCWKKSGFKDEDASGFDPDYAGERMDPDY